MVKVVRLAPEYECDPLWLSTQSGVENIPACHLPIDAALVDEVQKWGAEYEATYVPEDPLASGFSTPREESDFVERGRDIAHRLAEELGSTWCVYFSVPGAGPREKIT
ncbi:hypothetical protein GCM10012287_08170 [Streptomyces daqingensis]|uniref:Uncharacterized protein n=1 Tax=Streptomyces daqingensis TaxID=1472640 RepID=A0ABQ2LX43_9ACTN|nr:hypothetical protein GCM10012287_08170 [Streptomyces daqingensis]